MTPPTVSLVSPTNSAIASGNLSISGTAADNIAVQKVEVSLDGGPWITASGTASWNFSLNSSNFLNGSHLISARATDTSGNMSGVSSVTVRFINVPGNYVQRISAGNPNDVLDCTNGTWVKDKAYTLGDFGYSIGGTNGNLANTITGICAQAQSLYQRERYSTNSGGFFFQFDCPEGVYEITLLEAETYWNGPGKRLFNVFIQGQQVLTNFDIYAAAGGMNLPISLVFTTPVLNSQLQVLFQPVVDNARISGLQARKIADVYSDSDGIPDWWRLAYFDHPLASAADNSRGSDDADGDGVSNLTEFLNGTGPLDATSFPTLPPFSIAQILNGGSNVQVICPTVTNWSYQLLGLDGLDAGSSWMNIGPLLPGNGGALTLNDTITNNERLYRVQAR
jgi:hypothetical protein